MHAEVFEKLQQFIADAKQQTDGALASAATWLRSLADSIDPTQPKGKSGDGEVCPFGGQELVALKTDCEHCIALQDAPKAKGTEVGAIGPGLKIALQLALAFLQQWLDKNKT